MSGINTRCLEERRLERLGQRFFVKFQMCWYHVTLHLDLELEHTLDVNSSGDHRVQVWSRSGHLIARINIGCNIFAGRYEFHSAHSGPTDYNTSLPLAGEVMNKICWQCSAILGRKHTVLERRPHKFRVCIVCTAVTT